MTFFGVLVISLLIIFLADYLRSATLNVLVLPVDAKISVNGQNLANGSHRFYPGTLSIRIERDGHESIEEKIDLKFGEVKIFHRYLNPINGDLSIFRKKRNYQLLKLIAKDQKMADFIKDIEKKKKIKTLLPLNSDFLSPDYSEEGASKNIIVNDGSTHSKCDEEFCLLVTMLRGNEKDVREMIGRFNFNYDDYKVIYE